ncbi:MAG: sugar ABC transporter permease [Devosia sp. 67-54]|uniref:carbohydrate ABC transporter permease n=1 Tax=unclassified Devosia TaxID=196773 RepID=UPI0009698F73|nr:MULTISPECIES: sugar ABC transporter permease [unclassified Devosia]MBN9305209.1 sugar ABC transporter permease [Devosia sp.]OJX14873.1 MAG: sugar ABC transporter permease [Devosia sp. 67-54]
MTSVAPARRRFYFSQRAVHLLFLVLPVLLFVTFFIYPIISTFYLSLQDWDGISKSMKFIGMANYVELLHEPRFFHAVLNNVTWLIFLLLGPTGLGLLLAAILDRGLRGERVFRIVYFLPFTIPAVAVAAIWRWVYEPTSGLLTTVLNVVGLGSLAQNWLGDPHVVNFALMGAVMWWMTGFSFLVFFAGLRNIPVECIEAARIEGATPWQIFWKVSFPLLWPSTIVVLGISAVDAMRLFDVVWATTNGGPAYASEVLATQMYDVAFGRFDMGRASAISVYLLILAGAVIMPYLYYMSLRVQASEAE